MELAGAVGGLDTAPVLEDQICHAKGHMGESVTRAGQRALFKETGDSAQQQPREALERLVFS